MKENQFVRAALLMVVVVVVLIGGWELHLRSRGLVADYDDGGPLWANQRQRIYEADDKTDIFIGSSRICYDLDPEEWKRWTGRNAIQLGLSGHCPLPFLRDLANDERFHGKLVVDVMELLYWSPVPAYSAEAQTDVDYYHHRTPAQWLSFHLGRPLESHLVFLNRRFLALNAQLDGLPIPNRAGVHGDARFPIEFWSTGYNRQVKMMPRFLWDTALQHQVTGVWDGFLTVLSKAPAPPANFDPAAAVIAETKQLVDKIRARGGEVVFVRCPSSDRFLDLERIIAPREKFWDPLIRVTGCKGYYFSDYPGLSKFKPVEWSHLSPSGAVHFTRELIKVLPDSFTQTPS
ncbi:MAG TPA: hypothetical protein VNW04_21250 [Puia sp.]|nr:hypothetical protein [Puia sp.]